MKLKTNNQGFTLVELIIYMALLGVFLLILTNILVAILRIKVGSQASSSVQQDGQFILNRLGYDINRASVAAVPNATTLNLTIGGQIYTYTLASSSLQLSQSGTTDILNGSGSTVSNLTFQRIANSGSQEETIRVQFTLHSLAQTGTTNESQTFMSTIGRRVK